MRLAQDWRRIAKKAWSFRLALLAGALGGVEIALPLFSESFPKHVFLGLSVMTTVGAAVARIVAQPKMQNEK